MTCPKCGRELGEGKLYCEHCGEEIHIVPDFVPEIELVVEESLSNVAAQVSPDKLNTDTQDLSDMDLNIFDKSVINKKLQTLYISGLVLMMIALISVVAIMFFHDNSAKYQAGLGDKQVEDGNYRKAISCYKKAVDLEPMDIDIRVKLADCYLVQGNLEMAIDVYKEMILIDPNSSLAYAEIIALYEEDGDYDAIDDFLQHYANDDIRASFVDYLALAPDFSYESGSYDEAIEVTLTNNSAGKIYYTIDGTMPDPNSPVYTDPIPLKKGKHRINAFFENDYGVFSSVATMDYDIMPKAPDDPVISLESGVYNEPQVITVTVPAGCSVYYTVDGSDPDRSSRIYGEPIPLEEGISHYKFVSIDNQNVSSDILEMNYKLDVETSFTSEQGLQYLYQYLTNKHYIKDITGASEYYPGNFSYLYADLRNIGGVSLYCYNEYYVYGTGARAMTSNIFGIDINSGAVYLLKHSANDSYTMSVF